jgi:hypothetical protein
VPLRVLLGLGDVVIHLPEESLYLAGDLQHFAGARQGPVLDLGRDPE